ncbi:MAG: calcium-binding protein, partial [Hyphomicrobiaceae bacterium]
MFWNPDGTTTVCVGSGFLYGDFSLPIAGTVDSLQHVASDNITVLADITGLTAANNDLGVMSGLSGPALIAYLFSGDDIIDGQNDPDSHLLSGEAGNDTITGSIDGDTISGGEGNDTINAGAGADVVDAGDGHDVAYGGLGGDQIQGGLGNDNLQGEGGNDTLDGGADNDGLIGGDGDDTLLGGDGSDGIFDDSGSTSLIDAGDGNDWVNVRTTMATV